MSKMYTIILAGGSGTRLFPLSRSKYPKQFIPLIGKDSLFQKAVHRALLFSNPDEIYIVTNIEHKFLVQNQLLELGTPDCHILTEPCGKNTLPAILYGTMEIYTESKDATILVLSSDQLIEENDNYKNAVKSAEALAKTHIITFGVVPTTPHTGYGYIKPGIALKTGFTVAEFKEKPDLETAKKYLNENYLWNAGIFCFSAQLFLEECKQYAPDVYRAFNESPAELAYEFTPKISIDYGILEKSAKVGVVPMKITWNDLGSFEALYAIHDKDTNGNAIDGECLAMDSSSNLIISDKLVATVGLNNMAIVDTPDVLMICPRTQSQDVGKLVEELNQNGDERAALHTTVNRPWGQYTVLMKSEKFQIKKISINPKQRISLQYHNHRSEHWVVVNGTAEVTNGTKKITLDTGESTFIPATEIHRLSNPADTPLEIIEVQIGDWISEEDIVRLNDDYERK